MEAGLKMFLQNKTKEEADTLLDEAGKSGSKVHHAIDLLFQGVELKPTGFTKEDIDNCHLVEPDLIKYLKKPFNKKEDICLRGFLNWCNTYKPEPKETEKIVWSKKYKYAGTLDFIGLITIKENKTKVQTRAVIDWKTSKGIYREYELQLASYWEAIKEEEENQSGQMPILYIVQLGVNKCGYRVVEVDNATDKVEQFLNLKKTFDYLYPDYKPYNYEFLDSYKLN